MSAPDREVVLWPSRGNYSRFRAVCDDSVPATFDEFEALAGERLLEIQKRHGIVLDKVAFDPDRMAQWCRSHFGKVDANARKHYAAFVALSD